MENRYRNSKIISIRREYIHNLDFTIKLSQEEIKDFNLVLTEFILVSSTLNKSKISEIKS